MSKNKNKTGFSLVEIMVSVLVLVVLALGGAAVMYQTGGGIQRQQNKREALVAANSIMEGVWNRSYESLRADSGSTTSTNEVVNGINMAGSLVISAETNDVDVNPYIELQAEIDHLDAETDVVIKTRRYEFGISRATYENE